MELPADLFEESETVICLRTKGGGEYKVTEEEMKAWELKYPKNGDVSGEFIKMRNWLEANPRKRKIDLRRFIVNWLNKGADEPLINESKRVSRFK